MARLTAHLIRNPGPHGGRRGRPARMLAALIALALVLGSVSPGWALAVEAESEGEGGGTAPPGLGNPGLEPGGPETVLEGLPGSGGGEEPEGGEGAPVEVEPPQELPVPEGAPAVEEPQAQPEPAVPAPGPPAVATPAAPSPEYAPAPTAPDYETSPPPAARQPVENEALVAPEASSEGANGHIQRKTRGHSQAVEPSGEAPATPAQAPQAPAPTAALPPDAVSGGPDRIAVGRSSYTVHPGDCLWLIAEAMLPAGAGDARIAAEVARLWRLNADRIGTGDPSLIYAGTVLRLS